MKKLFTSSLFLLILSATSFGQLMQKKMMQSTKTVTAVPIVKQPPGAKTVMKEPAVQNNNLSQYANQVPLQKTVVNIVAGDEGKDKDSKLRITIDADNCGVSNHLCAYYGGGDPISPISSDAYLPGENVTIPTNLYAGIPYVISEFGLPREAGDREAVFSDFSNGGDIQLVFVTTHDIWEIKSLTPALYFNDSGTPHKITWTNIQLSQDVEFKRLQFDKNFNPIQ